MVETKILTHAPPQAIAAVTQELAALFGNRLVTSQAVRQQHANTLTWIENQPPDAVVYPHDTGEVAAAVKICARHGVPVIPFGTGTSFEGHTNAPLGGVSIDTSMMKRIIAVHPEDMDVVLEPGVTRKELNEHLRDAGLFFPIDPGADASIGGMAATRASGTNAVRYGTMKDNVLALKIVTASGEVVTTSRRARKSSAGYDLTRLMVGSEGTLGVITEVTLQLQGIPEAISAGICPFPSVRAACDATILTIQTGLPVARIELLDAMQVRACNLYSKLTLPETPMLFVEFHGTHASVKEQSERFGEIAAEHGGGPFDWATKGEDRTRLWQARHDAFWAAQILRPGSRGVSSDVCVPLSRLAECVEATQADIAASGLTAPIVGSHPVFAPDPDVADLVRRYHDAASAEADRPVGKLVGILTHSEDLSIESTAAEFIADAQLYDARSANHRRADLALMNNGGARTDLLPDAEGVVRFGQIFAMQPFANAIVTRALTGAQLKAVLEQQFDSDRNTIAKPNILAPSANFTFSFDRSRPAGQRIVAMILEGQPIDPARSYRVAINNFLSSGGDNFTGFTAGSDPVDGGLDLDATEAYLATNPTAPKLGRVIDLTPKP